jgi:cell division protein FtsW
MVMLFSASTGQTEAKYLVRQPIWAGLGLVACLTATLFNYQWLKKHWTIPVALFLVSLGLLALVLVPHVGVTRNGATRWIGRGAFGVQPSEFTKLALIILLAWYGERFQKRLHTIRWGVLGPGLFVGAALLLIFKEPDWGTTVLLAAVSGVLLFLAGTRWYYLGTGAIGGLAGLWYMIQRDPVRGDRWLAFLDPEKHKEGAAYQTYQGMVAMGTGGVQGLGLGDGRQKLGFVPEHHTDFILSVIGEELGLIATLLVVLAYVAVILCGIYISWHSHDTFGMLLGAGITSLIAFQAAINMGVVTGSLPNKGLALPFISYGGSNLVLMLGCIGMLLSIARRAVVPEALPRNPFAGPSAAGSVS